MTHAARKLGEHDLHPQTLMLGYGYDPALSEGSIKCPVFQTSTFVFRKAQDGKRAFEIAHGKRDLDLGEVPELIYSRINNPNLEIVEQRLAVWEDADKALVFCSGNAAISSTLLTFARPGSVVLHSNPLYGGTDHLLNDVLPLFGVRAMPIPGLGEPDDVAAGLAAAQAMGPIAAVLVETPANPTNRLYDLEAIARLLQERYAEGDERPPLIVDNTLLGPLWQQPLRCGADLSVYSLTKYVGGHSDLIAGGCLGDAARIAKVRGMRTFLGGVCDPHTAWLLSRSLETMELRMQRAAENARIVADFLRGHAKIADVAYLGHIDLASEQGRIFQAQCSGPGSTFSIRLRGGESQSYRFLDSLRIFKLAVSLGGTESLASHPATMTHGAVSPASKIEFGIGADLVRLSVGIEHAEDLIADVTQALAAV